METFPIPKNTSDKKPDKLVIEQVSEEKVESVLEVLDGSPDFNIPPKFPARKGEGWRESRI